MIASFLSLGWPAEAPIIGQICARGKMAVVLLSVMRGTDNRALSLARAQAVVKALAGQQVAADRLSAGGKGADQPIADNASEAGRAKNRRVELVRS